MRAFFPFSSLHSLQALLRTHDVTQAISPTSTTNLQSQAQGLRLIYQNDTHMAWDKLPNAVTAFDLFTKEGKKNGSDVLRLHGGDYMTGSSQRNFSLALWIASRMGLHGVALGNHELDIGLPMFVQQLKQWANFPTFVSNLAIKPNSQGENLFKELRDSGFLKINPQIIRKPSGTYALLGVTQPTERFKTRPENKEIGVDTKSFQETIVAIQKEVNKLKQQGVHNIILLSHMGYFDDCKLAQQIEGLSVILGGDSHHVLSGAQPGVNLLKSSSGRNVLVLQAGHESEYVGVADFKFDPSGQPIHIQNKLYGSAQFPKDAMTQQVIDQVLPPDTYVTNLTQPFLKNKASNPNQPLAEFLADEIRVQSKADIAFLRRPELRGSLKTGPLYSREIDKILPYDEAQVLLKLSGKTIQEGLDNYIGYSSKSKYSVLYPSGLKYTLDVKQRCAENIQVFDSEQKNWQPLEEAKQYTVVMNPYVFKSPSIAPKFTRPEYVVGYYPKSFKEILIEGLQRQTSPSGQFTPPQSDGRLTIVN